VKIKSFLLVLIFALTPVMWAQEQPAQAPPGTGVGDQMRPEHRQQMMEMHKQEMEAMKADVEKMRSSLAQMKANVLAIKDTNEMARWRNNVDMWETLVGHMERMQKHMESMGPGMMHGHGMGGPPPTPPTKTNLSKRTKYCRPQAWDDPKPSRSTCEGFSIKRELWNSWHKMAITPTLEHFHRI